MAYRRKSYKSYSSNRTSSRAYSGRARSPRRYAASARRNVSARPQVLRIELVQAGAGSAAAFGPAIAGAVGVAAGTPPRKARF